MNVVFSQSLKCLNLLIPEFTYVIPEVNAMWDYCKGICKFYYLFKLFYYNSNHSILSVYSSQLVEIVTDFLFCRSIFDKNKFSCLILNVNLM